MRLASFNVENLFSRARALNQETWAEGRPVLDAFARFGALIAKPVYSAADRATLVALLGELGLARSDDAAFVRLRRNRGEFLVRRRSGPVEIVAAGRAAWNGWLELEREPVDDTAMRLTARVIRDLDADVIGIVEAESRPALKAFSETILPREQAAPYRHVMLIDGNDSRGIDCALMTRAAHPILTMRSHVDLADAAGPVFSRDCPVFQLEAPGGGLVVLVNHFKSKGFGTPAASDARRRRQAEAVAGIYRRLRAEGAERIAVLGDLNDTPPGAAADPLHPLLAGTDLRDISTLPGHDDQGRPGTYGGSTAANKIDYILLSPALRQRAGASGIFRMGQWPGVRPRKWEVYPEIDPAQGGAAAHAASDHAALWVELDL
ncbi:endonuclease/exonuclease/phosphatase family protein [Dankookia sp. GCM10030260]|uniref:endonuclease/exonuclease/phosphatase family protein n=1 Tax=Dankookia sp. GCM10030260 TaxID=3273390 RepID=UPI0036196733